MSTSREAAYAQLRGTRPRPAVAGAPVEAFIARLRRQGGTVTRLDSLAAIPAWLHQHFGNADGTQLEIVGAGLARDARVGLKPDLHVGAGLARDSSLDIELLSTLSTDPRILCHAPTSRPACALALTTAFAAVAETGSLAVHARAGVPMALNFLPDRLVIVVRETDVLANLEDFWERVRARFGNALPRGLCLVSGPSSSGDIAMQFATGVHGPIELHVLVIGAPTS